MTVPLFINWLTGQPQEIGTAYSFTQGSVLFAGANGIVSQDNANFFWDDTGHRLAIGTASPQTGVALTLTTNASAPAAQITTSLLHIIGADGSNTSNIELDSYGSGASPNILGVMGRNTQANPSAITTDDRMLFFGGTGFDGSAMAGNKAAIYLAAAELWSSTNHGTYIAFATTPTGSSSRTEGMRVNPSGGLGIGTTTDPGAGSLAVNGTFQINQTPTTIVGTSDISIGSNGTMNKRISINMNGTTYWFPCSTTAF